MAKRKRYFLFAAIGMTAGVLFGLIKARASSPDIDNPAKAPAATVFYDERWQAVDTAGSAAGTFGQADVPVKITTPGGEMTGTATVDYVKSYPKIVVTKWKVHGHIHFQ